MQTLPRIRSGLLRHPLDGQVLVYDTLTSQVHLLDPATACVLELLDEGRATAQHVTAQLAIRLDIAPDPALLDLALAELHRAGLLDDTEALPSAVTGLNRRETVRKLAMTGAAALLVPTIATLTATRGYAQTSIVGGETGPCTSDAQCGGGLVCCNGVCSATCLGVVGDACTADAQCASNNCCGGFCSVTTCKGSCEACLADSECESGACGSGGACVFGGSGQDENKSPNGTACGNANGQCCSNNCQNGFCAP